MQAVQSMPNLGEGSAAVRFGEIKFMINLIGGVEAQHSVKLSSASHCASLVARLKPKSSIHNEPAQGADKSPVISDYSHCRFTGLLCSDQKRSLKHLIPTVGEGPHSCQLGGSASRAKKLPTTEKQSENLPALPLAVLLRHNNHTHAETFSAHVYAEDSQRNVTRSPFINQTVSEGGGDVRHVGPDLLAKDKLFFFLTDIWFSASCRPFLYCSQRFTVGVRGLKNQQ